MVIISINDFNYIGDAADDDDEDEPSGGEVQNWTGV